MAGGPRSDAGSAQPGGDRPHAGPVAHPGPTGPPVQPDAPGPPDVPVQPELTGQPTTPHADQRPRERWHTSAGLSAIAAILGCLVAVASLILTNVIDLRPEARVESSSGGQVAGSVPTDNLIFVYGSSQPGQARYAAIQPHVAEQHEDSVNGYLYDSGLDYRSPSSGPASRSRVGC